MTSKEILASEQANTQRIVLHREGLFWRAYERSAYALCTQIHPFKAVKRSMKVLGGEELVYAGFPLSSEEKFLSALPCQRHGETLSVILTSPIDLSGFATWKSMVPLTVRQPAAAPPAPIPGTPRQAVAAHVVAAVRSFNLAQRTPMEAMQLLYELQKMLNNNDSHGTV